MKKKYNKKNYIHVYPKRIMKKLKNEIYDFIKYENMYIRHHMYNHYPDNIDDVEYIPVTTVQIIQNEQHIYITAKIIKKITRWCFNNVF